MNNQKLLVRTIFVVAILIAVMSIFVIFTLESKRSLSQAKETDNSTVQVGGDFELIDQDGNIYGSKNLKGKLSLIYFGFTYCPDICPDSLHKLVNVMQILDKYQIDVVPVFITIDPKRDDPKVLKEYLAHFNNKFIGLTGTTEQIKKVAELFKVYYARANNDLSSNYMLDHSSFVYLMNKDGRYLKHFSTSSTVQEIVEFVRINR
ncbi:MAG: SCO family protein [Rickettsiaceae bacterium]|nr:MAG: SCO family protein [Rickettsiaceae bacterium]